MTGPRGGRSGLRMPAESRHSSLPRNVQTGSGAHSSSIRYVATVLSSGVRRPRREADY
jgi:hypothetical protein